jgi:hypothetical protein
MIVGEWDQHSGPRLRWNPECQMLMSQSDGRIRVDDPPCGKPATVLVNYLPYWMQAWCPEHATLFTDRANGVHALTP